MIRELKRLANGALGVFGIHLCKKATMHQLLEAICDGEPPPLALHDIFHSPLKNFTHPATLGLTKRRQEHLASLHLDLSGKTVLEVGAGIGDHTSFFLDRGCKVLATEGRPENLGAFRRRYFHAWSSYKHLPNLEIAQLDVENPPTDFDRMFDIVYCYGLLYHVREPLPVLRFLAHCCRSLLLLETSVSFGSDERVVGGREDDQVISQSIHGYGSHPTRPWIYQRLKEAFPFVYLPLTQPSHEQFPLDWTRCVETPGAAQRAVFVASRQRLDSPLLGEGLPLVQRCA